MIEYFVMLRRFPGSSRPDVCIFRGEDREEALRAMREYAKRQGFAVQDHDGLHAISTISLVEKETIVGIPMLSDVDIPYHKLFDPLGDRKL